MILALPSNEAKAALLVEHAARYPEAFTFTLLADGGKPDQLRILLGTPVDNSAGWEAAVAATFKPRTAVSDNPQLVIDCLLWPDLATWGGLVRRWPALPETVARAVRHKLGGSLAALVEPPTTATPPDELTGALARNAGAVWRQLRPTAIDTIDVVIQPPEEMVWRMFQDEVSRDDAKHWRLGLDMATASVTASTEPVGDTFRRWPGCAMLVALMASKLAGVAAEYEQEKF
jgi:hypothetical protein